MQNDKPKTTTIDKPKEKTKYCPLFKVLIHNDDVNDMYHISMSLVKTFRIEPKKAYDIMMEAHTNGMALCVVEPKEAAEHHRDCLQTFSITVTIEPA